MKVILAFMLATALMLPASHVLGGTIDVGPGLNGNVKVQNNCKEPTFPMGAGGGRTTNQAIANPLVGAVARTAALENTAKKITDSFNQTSNMFFSAENEKGRNCLVDINMEVLGKGSFGDALLDVINAAVDYVLSEACKWLLDQIMGTVDDVMNIYSQASVSIPLVGGTIGASDFLKISASPGGGGITYTVNDKSDSVNNIDGRTADNVKKILGKTKSSTFQERLKSGK